MTKDTFMNMKTGNFLQIKANSTVGSSIDFKMEGYIKIGPIMRAEALNFHIEITSSTSCAILVTEREVGPCRWNSSYSLPDVEKKKESIIWSIVKKESYLGVKVGSHEGWTFDISSDNTCRLWREKFDYLTFLESDNASIAYRILINGNYPNYNYQLISHFLTL